MPLCPPGTNIGVMEVEEGVEEAELVISPGEENEDSEVEYDDEVKEESEGFSAGNVVWGRVRSWWPGQVIDVSEIADLQSLHLGGAPL